MNRSETAEKWSEIYGANIYKKKKYHFNGLPLSQTSLSLPLQAIWVEPLVEMIKN